MRGVLRIRTLFRFRVTTPIKLCFRHSLQRGSSCGRGLGVGGVMEIEGVAYWGRGYGRGPIPPLLPNFPLIDLKIDPKSPPNPFLPLFLNFLIQIPPKAPKSTPKHPKLPPKAPKYPPDHPKTQ